MKIRKHAVRRYKQRIGSKSASKRRIVDKINKEIENNTLRKIFNKKTSYYRIETTNFIAICKKNAVITILDK